MINIFKIFKRKEPPYDESSDCFLAMQYAIKQYKEEYGWLSTHEKVLKENNIEMGKE